MIQRQTRQYCTYNMMEGKWERGRVCVCVCSTHLSVWVSAYVCNPSTACYLGCQICLAVCMFTSNALYLHSIVPPRCRYPNNPGPNPLNPGGMSAADCVQFPGFTHALCWAFRTDNSGPPESVDEVMSYFEIARYQFPGAEVSQSTPISKPSHLLNNTATYNIICVAGVRVYV
jgi:hypothetical protein